MNIPNNTNVQETMHMLKKLTNLSLKVKLIGGFALVALITLAVGLIGYHGVDMAGDQIESLANDHLPGIENILRIKADFETIIASQMTLVNPLLTSRNGKSNTTTWPRPGRIISGPLKITRPSAHDGGAEEVVAGPGQTDQGLEDGK